MKTLVDTGPLVSAIDQERSAHEMAASRSLGLAATPSPMPVLVEVDHLVSKRAG